MRFLDYAPILHISALTGERAPKVLETIDKVAAARRKRVPTPALNKFIEAVTAANPPVSPGRKHVRIMYAAQIGVAPPSFVFFTNVATTFHFSYERFLINQLREQFGFYGTPIRIQVRRRAKGEPPRPTSGSRRGSAILFGAGRIVAAQIEIPKRALFKAAEVCELVKVQPYVLRSWESEFPELGVAKTAGGAARLPAQRCRAGAADQASAAGRRLDAGRRAAPARGRNGAGCRRRAARRADRPERARAADRGEARAAVDSRSARATGKSSAPRRSRASARRQQRPGSRAGKRVGVRQRNDRAQRMRRRKTSRRSTITVRDVA